MRVIHLAREILAALTAGGYQAYIVGGAVRDHILGKISTDIDIATDALPEAIKQIAHSRGWKTVEVGAAFGVIIIVLGGQSYEVTTFRSEVYGEDSHRPASVSYCSTLSEDLSRRDFTMNALALDGEGHIVDQFGGMSDIEKKVIRSVGSAERRFNEDALRMFRAARFSAQLGFTIAEETMQAIPLCLARVSGLSAERVRTEIEKTLLSEFAGQGLTVMLRSGLLDCHCRSREKGLAESIPIMPELRHLDGLPQNPAYHNYDGWGHTLAVVSEAPKDLTLRWAALLHDIGKGLPGVRIINKRGTWSDPGHDVKGAELAHSILERLKAPPDQVKRIAWLVRRHMQMPEPEPKAVLKWLRRLSQQFAKFEHLKQAVDQLLSLHWADRVGGHVDPGVETWRTVSKITQEMVCSMPFYPSQLTISGGDIAEQIGTGEQVRLFQQDLLTRIQTGGLENRREVLMKALAARVKRKWER